MQKILSISIAAYNAEKFINQCLNSFVENSSIIDKLDIMVIDDGGTDKTKEITYEYIKKHPDSIRFIHKENQGPGSTVNVGIKNAKAKYFRMVDGDDWVNSEAMPSYISYLENHDVDMICTHFCCVDDKTGEQKNQVMNAVKYNEIVSFDSVANKLNLEMHNTTFRTDKVKDIVLDNGFYTDVEYLLLPTDKIQTFVALDLVIYMYRTSLDTQSMNINSLQKNIKMHEDVLSTLLNHYKVMLNKNISSEKIDYFENRIVKLIGTQLMIYLSYGNSSIYKDKTKNLFGNIKEQYPSLYKKVLGLKTVKVLENTNYVLYGLVANIKRKQLNAK